jgi:hypothetical protein
MVSSSQAELKRVDYGLPASHTNERAGERVVQVVEQGYPPMTADKTLLSTASFRSSPVERGRSSILDAGTVAAALLYPETISLTSSIVAAVSWEHVPEAVLDRVPSRLTAYR